MRVDDRLMDTDVEAIKTQKTKSVMDKVRTKCHKVPSVVFFFNTT